MGRSLLAKIKGKELFLFSIATVLVLYVGAFCLNTPREIVSGMVEILLSRDALITDYFELANYGAALFNGATVLALAIGLICRVKVPFTGFTIAVLFINLGFALFGKNPLNVWPIIVGTFLYAKLHRSGMSRYIYTALFGSCLAPVVTEIVYLLPFSLPVNMFCAIVTGIFVGYVLPPLSMHTASMHMGYNLFNVGFSAGLLAFVLVCILQSVGLTSSTVLIWRAGRPTWLIVALYAYFLLTIVYGFWINGCSFKGCVRLLRHPGRAVADFVLMDGVGITLINMGIVGILCMTYMLLIGGDLSGPVVGAMLTAFGFAAFGVHIRNYIPVLAGVFLSTFLNHLAPTTPAVQLGALFAVGLAPITGQFGIFAGMLAGALHGVVVVCTSSLYGGLNLYNGGFSTGMVAIVLVPILESFMIRFKKKS